MARGEARLLLLTGEAHEAVEVLDRAGVTGPEAVVLRALEKDPARRFQTVRELAAALRYRDSAGVFTALDAAPKWGWIVVSMKDDWGKVFPFEA